MHGRTVSVGKTVCEAVVFEGKADSAASRRCGTAVRVDGQPYECTFDQRALLEGSG